MCLIFHTTVVVFFVIYIPTINTERQTPSFTSDFINRCYRVRELIHKMFVAPENGAKGNNFTNGCGVAGWDLEVY